MATLAELTTDIAIALSINAGINTNVYTEDRVAQIVNNQFEILFRRRFWDDFMSTETYTLDTTTGLITGDISSICTRFKDIQYVWIAGQKYPLRRAAENINPELLRRPTYEPYKLDATKLFRIRPADSSDTCTVRARLFPGRLEADDEVEMDNVLIKFGVMYQYVIENGSNQEAAQLYQRQFEALLATYEKEENYSEVHPDASDGYGNTEWVDA